ncbi:MAG: hypothetical protein K2Q25_14645 [Mycobacteriaceae bacterium]|nr:hypothetical protein [Mycobacteriaceae bacterium]
MTTAGFPVPVRGLRATTAHATATIIAILTGSYALVALLIGSPLEFGLSLAVCSTCWIAAYYVERTVEQEHASARRIVMRERFAAGDGFDQPLFVGGDAYRPRRHGHQ